MAINIELFTKVINDNLFQGNPMFGTATDHSEYVSYFGSDGAEKSAAVVHVPSAGAVPTITKNRSSFPITALQRTDVDLTYNVNTYDAGVWYLTPQEAMTVAYNKADSLVREQINKVAETLGNQTLYAWAPVSATTYGVTRILRTSGALDGSALASGATGSRSAITLSDFARAKNMLDNDRMPMDNERYFTLPSSMWNGQVLQLANITQFLQLGSTTGLQEGTITPQSRPGYVGRIYGFNVMERPTVVTYTTGATPSLIAIGDDGVQTTSNSTDNLGAIFYHKIAVSNAIGKSILSYNANRAEYGGGNLFYAAVRHGAAQIRANMTNGQLGVGAVVQQ